MKQYFRQSLTVFTGLTLLAVSLPLPAQAVDAASPLINRNVPVYSDSQGTAYASNNDIYYAAWYGSAGGYLAYDLSEVPADQRGRVNVAWYTTIWGDYDYTVKNSSATASPSAYKIYGNAAKGGVYPEDGWVELCSVTDYTAVSGQNVVDMTGYQWIKLEILETANGGSSVSLNVDIHDCSGDIVDSWIFYGDSITAGGMTTFSTGDGNFADHVHAIDERYYPAQQNGGIGGIFSTDGKNNIDRWLTWFPGQYVSIAYGTNDSWGNQTGAENYYNNLAYMVEAIHAAGKTAVLPTIPYSTESGITAYIEDYNAMVYRIYENYPDVVKGPDFYSIIKENPDYLSSDGVHPSTEGYNQMRIIWAESMYDAIYADYDSEQPDTALPGDVNEDGERSVADAVQLIRYLTAVNTTLPEHWQTTTDLNSDSVVDASDLALVKQQVFAYIPMPL